MKAAILKSVAAITSLLTLPISLRLGAQDVQAPNTSQAQYSVINLGTLGGSASNGFGGVNARGWVTGDANLAGDQNEHAFLWRDGVMTDLGTLGGPNSSVPTPVKDDKGLIVGGAQSATVDPLGEFWGAAYFCTANNCQGWRLGQPVPDGDRHGDGVHEVQADLSQVHSPRWSRRKSWAGTCTAVA